MASLRGADALNGNGVSRPATTPAAALAIIVASTASSMRAKYAKPSGST